MNGKLLPEARGFYLDQPRRRVRVERRDVVVRAISARIGDPLDPPGQIGTSLVLVKPSLLEVHDPLVTQASQLTVLGVPSHEVGPVEWARRSESRPNAARKVDHLRA